MAAQDERDDLLRILIATDNHLGVWEKDEIRKDDSFRSFEEILELAREQKVDFVLLGGDLFHENNPSRATLGRTIDILSRHCLNSDPCSFQILSDQAQNFANGCANFLSEHHNVGLPVFTIHGNHDDPSGADNLSAVDLLSKANLVNYFGKLSFTGSTIGKIRLAPILLKKGGTCVALYGLGNVRDERLGRMFQTPGCIEWVRPEATPEYPQEGWYNLFVLHQNRVQRGASLKNSVRVQDLPHFLDFVVWGHEHDCIPETMQGVEGQEFDVLQPGSSVATALSEGEAQPKHVFVLELMGANFRIIPLPLATVRPFLHENICLKDQGDLDPEDGEGLTAVLEAQVDSMIERAVRCSSNPGAEAMLPLIRLRVDYTGFSTINVQRFGQKYVGRVANPHDILLWHKAPAKKPKGPADAVPQGLLRPTELDERQIEELIADNLNQALEIVNEVDLGHALHNFVEKDERNALTNCIAQALEDAQEAVSADPAGRGSTEDADMAAAVQRHAALRRASAMGGPGGRARQPGDARAASERDGGGAGPLQGANDSPASDMDEGPAGRSGAAHPASGVGTAGRAPRQSTIGESLARGAASMQVPLTARNGPRAESAATYSKTDTNLVATTQRSVAGWGGVGRGRGRGTAAAKRKPPARATAARGRKRAPEEMEAENDDADELSDGMELDGRDDVEEVSDDDLVDMTADDSDDDNVGASRPSRPAAKPGRRGRATLTVRKTTSTATAPRGRSSKTAAPLAGSLLADSDDENGAAPASAPRFARKGTTAQAAGTSQQRPRLWEQLR